MGLKIKPKKRPWLVVNCFFFTVYLAVGRIQNQVLGNKLYQKLGSMQNHVSISAQTSRYQEIPPH